jgi:hypothetical protein
MSPAIGLDGPQSAPEPANCEKAMKVVQTSKELDFPVSQMDINSNE